MSVLQVTDIQSNSTSFNTPVVFKTSGGAENGTLCRAWVNFNGTGTVAIRADFNVNTITDHGTGRYTINLTNALTDANFVSVFNGNESTANSGRFFSAPETSSPTSSTIRCRFLTFAGTSIDAEFAHAAFFR